MGFVAHLFISPYNSNIDNRNSRSRLSPTFLSALTTISPRSCIRRGFLPVSAFLCLSAFPTFYEGKAMCIWVRRHQRINTPCIMLSD